MFGIIIAIIAFILFVLVLMSIKVVNTGYQFVAERFGQFFRVLEPGWHILIPFVDFVRRRVSTKQQILDINLRMLLLRTMLKYQLITLFSIRS
jgi:regulator of protease activity HflC (stomatin/prohibitin superfamily)